MQTQIDELSLASNGFLCRTVRLRNEGYDFVDDPEALLSRIARSDMRADLVTFTQSIADPTPRYAYHQEWDTLAVLPIASYEQWWKRQINDKTRNMARKAAKKGVVVKVVPFDDDLVRGIKSIYDETPIRQGKRFKHFGKDLEALRAAHATYLERSQFIGAFLEDRLIGFIKLVHQNGWSNLMQILSLVSERDKSPTNALIAKAVEICAEANVPRLQYGVWSRRGIGEFKQRHDFQPYRVPRYYVPVSTIGSLALSLGLHRPLIARAPDEWLDRAANIRARWLEATSPSA